MNNAPIFIGGMQRSGTSLMRAIVGSHPEVAIHETDLPLWTQVYAKFKTQDLSHRSIINKLLESIFEHKKVKSSTVIPTREAVQNRLLKRNEEQVTCGVVFECFLEAYAEVLGRQRWGLKTPHNEFFAQDIFEAYPNARMVHLVRDPRDVAVSYKSYYGGAWKYCPRRHISMWQKSVELANRNSERYSGQYLMVRYEDLVLHTEKTVRAVCTTLNIDYRPDMLEMVGQLGWRGGNSFFDDVGMESKEISTDAIGRYRTNLPRDLAYMYQKKLRTDLIRLRYVLEPFTSTDRLVYDIKLTLLNDTKWMLRRLKSRVNRLYERYSMHN